MKFTIFIPVLFGICFGDEYNEHRDSDVTCDCGWTNTARIVGGQVSVENAYPWMAGLLKKTRMVHFCGGAVITRWHVLTVAHCTRLRAPHIIAVVVGSHNLRDLSDSISQMLDVDEIIQHPKYDSDHRSNDISIIVTQEEIKFTKYVGPACFPDKTVRDELNNDYVKAKGWGYYANGDSNKKRMENLKEIDLKVILNRDCIKEHPKYIEEGTYNHICTYSQQGDTCNGDSGGPLVWLDPEINRYVLVGLISFGSTVCGGPKPSVNVNVSAYSNWILPKLKEDVNVCTKYTYTTFKS